MKDDLVTAPTLMSDSSATTQSQPESLMQATLQTGPRSVLPRLESADGAVRLIPEPKERYRLLRLLGEGGMGKVELAEDQDIGRTVAVKHLYSDQGLARFVQEIRTVGRLDHPNIVPIHDVGVDEQGHFFVMKYVEGETLRDIISKLDQGDLDYHRRFSFEGRVQLFLGLLRALQFAHAQGVLHRDIKPENVMVGRYGEVVLMDWGIAKVINAQLATSRVAVRPAESPASGSSSSADHPFSTRAEHLLGTAPYMSPEQARGEHDRLDARSDLYSAAVVLYELLTLRHYLAGRRSLLDVLTGVIEEPLRPGQVLTTRHPHQSRLPAELVHILRRGMEKDPARRFQSAEEMIEQLQRIAEGRHQVRCAFTLSKRVVRELGRFMDRHPMVGIAVLLSAAGLLVLGGVRLVQLLL